VCVAGALACHDGSVIEEPTIAGVRATLDRARASGATVGFVPTMGYLHEGHGSLIRQAAEECDLVVVSIFVNPLQFAVNEDLADYPRDLPADLALAERCGADVVFNPMVTEMYPFGPVLTSVSVPKLSFAYEGAARPTHFAGVATVVVKLFAIVGPCRAYFGEKDFQQLAVVRRAAADLSLPVEVIGCPIVREADGLAMSSRNVYLTDEERTAAPVLHRALEAGVALAAGGERRGAAIEAAVTDVLAAEPLIAALDYVALVDPDSLQPVAELAAGQQARLLVAARLGKPRLLDNVAVQARLWSGNDLTARDLRLLR